VGERSEGRLEDSGRQEKRRSTPEGGDSTTVERLGDDLNLDVSLHTSPFKIGGDGSRSPGK